MDDTDRTFNFPHTNHRPEKPRDTGITVIRGPYYDPMGPRELRVIVGSSWSLPERRYCIVASQPEIP